MTTKKRKQFIDAIQTIISAAEDVVAAKKVLLAEPRAKAKHEDKKRKSCAN